MSTFSSVAWGLAVRGAPVALATLVALILVLGIPGRAQERSTQKLNAQQAQQDEAFRKGGLQAAARIVGSYTRVVPAVEPNAPAGLEELVKLSEHILVASVETSGSHLVEGGRSIVLLSNLKVERSLKGSVGEAVLVAVPGGQVTFSDGSQATMRQTGVLWPSLGQRDVWFLQRAAGELTKLSEGDVHVPAFGPLGVYQLYYNDKVIIPRGLYRTYLANSVLRMRLTSEAFLNRIDQLVRR